MNDATPWLRELDGWTYLGGSHYGLSEGQEVSLSFGPDALVMEVAPSSKPRRPDSSAQQLGTPARSIRIALAEILALSIGGPGQVTTGGGVIGGGFGMAGALEGMAIAGVINA